MLLYTDGTTEATRQEAVDYINELDSVALDAALEAQKDATQAEINAIPKLGAQGIAAEKDAANTTGSHIADVTRVTVIIPTAGKTNYELAAMNLVQIDCAQIFGGVAHTAAAEKFRMKVSKATLFFAHIEAAIP